MRRTAGVLTASITILALAVSNQPRAVAQEDAIDLSLLAQNFAIVPNGVVHLEYELTGLVPDPTPVPTTTPASSIPTRSDHDRSDRDRSRRPDVDTEYRRDT